VQVRPNRSFPVHCCQDLALRLAAQPNVRAMTSTPAILRKVKSRTATSTSTSRAVRTVRFTSTGNSCPRKNGFEKVDHHFLPVNRAHQVDKFAPNETSALSKPQTPERFGSRKRSPGRPGRIPSGESSTNAGNAPRLLQRLPRGEPPVMS